MKIPLDVKIKWVLSEWLIKIEMWIAHSKLFFFEYIRTLCLLTISNWRIRLSNSAESKLFELVRKIKEDA